MIQTNKIIKTLAYTVLVGATSLCLLANAQQTNTNNLPPCPKPDYSKSSDLGAGGRTEKWTKCWGKYRVELDSNFKGDILEGEWLDGRLHGQGTYFHLANNANKGDQYVGEFKESKKHGQGTYTKTNVGKYVGEWKDDMYNGQGVFTFLNGGKQEGIWENNGFIREAKVNLPNFNKNVATNIDRTDIDAQQTNPNNLPPCPKPDYSKSADFGVGGRTEKWTKCWGRYRVELYEPNKGDLLEGEWLDGRLHGQGTYQFLANNQFRGDKYVGEYREGNWNGQGTYTHASGNKYVGQHKTGYRHGQGIFYFLADDQWKGDKYVGEYRDGTWNGRGTYMHANGDKYVGEFRDGKANGQGTYAYNNGNKYVGELRDGKLEGQGTYTYANSEKYVGEFKDDKRNGQGVFAFADGRRQEGIWEKDNFIREAKINLPNLNSNVVTNTDRTDIDRERQQLAEERRRLEEEKRRLQQNNQRDNAAIPTDNRRRFALVIGNANYSSLPKLQNAINDARAMTQALRSTGFSVATHENLDLTGMQNAVRTFGEQLGKNDVGLIFFAGHGVQVKGKNYLVPVRENIKKSFEVPSNALDVDLVLATLENVKNDLNIVVLDACRSPFPGESRGASRGLATLEAGKGIFVAFSTSPGKEASDGSDANSPYTKNLSRLLTEKGLSLEKVFKEVRKAVVSETNGEQIPWENSSLMGDFYFKQ